MKFISSMYMPKRNFWCMTGGDSSNLNFQLLKVDWGPLRRQKWRNTMEYWKILYIKILYIYFIREPKGITYVGFFLQFESHNVPCTTPPDYGRTGYISATCAMLTRLQKLHLSRLPMNYRWTFYNFPW